MQVPTPSRPSSVSAHSRSYTPGPISPAVPGLASNGQVRITYTLAQSLQSSPHAAVITESLRSKLNPLRNLHWRPTAGTLPGSSIRTIQYLDAELVSLDLGPSTARLSTAEGFGGEGGRSQIPGTVLEKPFINLWLGMCDDADTYKNVIRRQLKDWVASVTTQSKRDQEWLIVLVNVTSPGQDVSGSGAKKLFQSKGIIDRMRADFTLAKRDRCVQLNYTTGGAEDPAAWTDLIAKIKDAIITTLDGRVAERMDDVRRTEAQRAVPGWNFCTFFVLKESIAESFEGMTLLDAALVQYSELEASFYQVLKEKNLSWFGKLGGTSPGDDAAPLLSVTKKPYRDLIMSNAISVFDFRCYLLARQCLLLAKMGAVADVASKAARFISSFARTLRENENSLSEPFLESWIYSCSLNVVDECDAWILGASGQESISDAKDVSYNAGKHELLELARAQLDKIGIRAGHLPRVAPFTTSLPDQPPKSRPTSASFDPHAAASDLNDADYKRLSRAGVTNATLLQAIDSSEAFDELYKQLLGRAIETCVASGRTRSAARLKGILAALYLHRGAVPDAKLVFSDLPTQYIEQRWPVLESYTRIQDLETSKDGEVHSNEEWIHRAMALLRADLSVPEDLRSKEVTARTQQLFEELLKRADGLSSDVTVNEFSPLVLRLVGDIARLDGTRDGSGLAVSVTNTLPITISLEYLKLTVLGPDGVQLLFEHWPTQLPSGDSMLMLLCPNPVFGLFTTAQHEYKISRLLFVEKAPETLDRSSLKRKSLSEARAVIRIPDDERAVKVGMMMPRHVVLGDPRVLFQIHTGRNTLKTGTLTVSSPGGQIKFVLESAKVLGDDAITATFKPDRIAVENLPADQEIVFSVPYVGAPRNDELEATIEFEYTTAAQTEVVRVVKTKCRAYIGLPLIVNINDKFRNKKLFTNVVIHSANQELVRVAGVALKNTSDHGKLAVKACKRAPVSVVVRPIRPAPFLFQIESSDPNEPPVGETLQLIIAYRSLHEDISKIVEHAANLITPNGSNPRIRKQQRGTIEATLLNETGWIDMLELIRLSDSSLDIETWAKQLVEKAPVKLELASVIEAIEDLRRLDMESPLDKKDEDSSWRTVTMPFDVPLMNIINRVQITPKLATGSQTYAGQPIDVALTISSLFHWSGLGPESEKSCMMRYDMACETDSGWLVCGPKRGEYIAMDGAEHTTQLTLLPLRHGTLSLPVVSVEPIENFEGGGRPTCETWQADGAKKMTVLPRNAKSTFVVAMPVPVI
ncbi:Trafficking protein particle complex subunit 10, TRAPPC10 [Ceratobasidium sp. AG-Ba]|nr:Trafficking protein particle complex subunit 10, TRAPPC10 [Ceratobasidium sp. AG-Ba]